MAKSPLIEQIVQQEQIFSEVYPRLRQDYERLAGEVEFVLQNEIGQSPIAVVSVSSRVKTLESILEKLSRKNYSDPLSDLPDLAGVRIVCSHEPDLEDIQGIIEDHFIVHEHVNKLDSLGIEKMGYSGHHFVVSLGSKYSGARYDGLTNLKCEIQVRTVLQDAWAIISHKLAYKNEAMVPDRLKRDLNNVASLLEIAQSVFDNVRDKRREYQKEITEIRDSGDRSTFLDQATDFETLLSYAKWKYPDLEPDEKINALLLKDLDLKVYPTLRRVDAAVERAAPAIEVYKKENPTVFKSSTDFLTKTFGFVDDDFRARHPFALVTKIALGKHRKLVRK